MRKIILVFCLLLITSGSISANPVQIDGIGSVELREGIIMTEIKDKKGEVNYSFKIKDGPVWRAALLLPISNLSANNFGNIIKMDVLLDRIIDEKLSKNPDVLSTEKASLTMLSGKECATTSAKMDIVSAGIVANMDMAIIAGSNGVTMFAFMCADSDTEYWRPMMQKILASVP